MRKILIGILIIGLIILTGCREIIEGSTINVAGDSELTFDPDQAEVWAGISVIEETAEEAQAQANKVINAIIDGLRYKGISEDDISTERLSLYEERVWDGGKSTIVGWRATQTLKIKTTDMTKVGIIVDIAVSNGANQINNINFGLSEEKEQEYRIQALAEATKNAKAKAEIVAEGLEVELGKIKSVSEPTYYYRPYVYAMEKTIGVAAVEEATQVMPGDVVITGHVDIVYYVK